MTFDEHHFFYPSNTKQVGSETEVQRETIRMEIAIPPYHIEEGEATPNSKENISQDTTEIPPINIFPKYYFKRKNKVLKEPTQPQTLEEEVTTQKDAIFGEIVVETLFIALRKEPCACVKLVPHVIVNLMNYGKYNQTIQVSLLLLIPQSFQIRSKKHFNTLTRNGPWMKRWKY